MADTPTRPTWHELRQRAEEAARFKAAPPLEAMHLRHGDGPEGTTCGDCAHLLPYRQSSTWWKCEEYRLTHSAATDFRKKWPSCGKFVAKGTTNA